MTKDPTSESIIYIMVIALELMSIYAFSQPAIIHVIIHVQ